MAKLSITSVSRMVAVFIWAFLSAAPASSEDIPDNPWPREIKAAQGTVVMYQPQPQRLDGNQLEYRAAVSVTLTGADEPVYGVVWFKSRIATDRDDRTVTIEDISVERMRFAEQGEGKGEKLKVLLETEIPKWDLEISLDRLLTTLELVESRAAATQNISTEAPIILFIPEPAVLITLDGEPRLKSVENSSLMRVINTPFSILLDTKQKTYFLNADAETWYTAGDIKGDWKVASSVPGEVAALAPKAEPAEAENEAEAENDEDADDAEPGPPPKIVIATQPTELISSTGEPEYTPISGTELLYMSNTDSDLLLHLTDQRYFVLLAGRWYASTSLDGPWLYVSGEDLPADFAKIPEDDQMATVLYAVPGTDVARDAAMDAQIPQTAKVERDKASLEVDYDGAPEFDEIAGTSMEYAINTVTPIILVGKEYYACDEGIWFVAGSAKGPWRVATAVPDVIYTIPPESPVYYVTYVRVYDHTPEVVYVGYTSGYTGTYVYNTTIVYGTGYYYPYWYGSYYYPRPSTWGFHVRYNPWTGWNFGLSYSTGPFTFVIGGGGWYRGGWWGPSRYRGYHRGYRHGYRRGARAGYRAGYRAGQRDKSRNNLYRSQRNQDRGAITRQQPTRDRAKPAGGNRQNDVFADRDGNVHRKTDQGWQERTSNGWQDQARDTSRQGQGERTANADRARNEPSQRTDRQSSSSRTRQLDHSNAARQRGTQRTNSYNRSRGGGGRAGGGRRR